MSYDLTDSCEPLNPDWGLWGRFTLALFGKDLLIKIGDEIHELAYQIDRKEIKLEKFQRQMDEDFSARVNQLKREKNYWAFNYSSYASLLANLKEEMRRELDAELRQEKQELAAIDNMIARINEIELQAQRE